MLRYLTDPGIMTEFPLNASPVISFNYLGQIDSDMERASFRIAEESYGESESSQRSRNYLIDFGGLITKGRLTISVSYNGKAFSVETMQQLTKSYITKLTELINHCASKDERELTPSDLTYKGLSQDEFDNFFD